MRNGICILSFLLSAAAGQTGSTSPVAPAGTRTMPPAIVIGFVGGFVRHDDPVHSEVQVAVHLNRDYSSDVLAETFENYRQGKAHQEVLRLLDVNHDGKLTVEEKRNARIIIYGHSWGGSQSLALARQLARDGIPVLLTIQVDSVSKFGQDDAIIPANVAQAANFYQSKGLVHGRREIRAADPAHTEIIGNFRFDYAANPLRCEQYPWWDRIFVKPHTQIECDPAVWNQVESLIRSKLPPATRGESAP
jgi:pimeloyl-ACP methyl ester carboxylesterase